MQAGSRRLAGQSPGYQVGVQGDWQFEDIFSTDDRVVVRWTGSGTQVADVNRIPATGKPISVDAITTHRMSSGKLAETWDVYDTLGFLQGNSGLLPLADGVRWTEDAGCQGAPYVECG